MDRISQLTVEKTFLASRRIGWSFLLCFLSAGLMSMITESSNQAWPDIIVPLIGGISLTSLAISWIMPGTFILLGVPWLARAWLRGMNPIISDKPWEQLSAIQVFFTYLWSLAISGFAILAVIGIIRSNF